MPPEAPPGPTARWKAPSTEGSSKIGVRGRTCIGCRRVRGKTEMVRLVRGAGGAATVDRTGAAPGRGAYVCPTDECFERGRRRIAGALRGAAVDADAIHSEIDAYRTEHGAGRMKAADAAQGDG